MLTAPTPRPKIFLWRDANSSKAKTEAASVVAVTLNVRQAPASQADITLGAKQAASADENLNMILMADIGDDADDVFQAGGVTHQLCVDGAAPAPCSCCSSFAV